MNDLIYVLTLMGGLSLYLVIATIVGRAIYSRTQGWTTDNRVSVAIFCGGLFPITVPLLILVLWVIAIINIPMGNNESLSTKDNLKDIEKVPEPKKCKAKFKVGDLVTGAKGNPNGYQILYPGCVCRVLQVDGEGDMEIILVDHIDKEAQENEIGRTFEVSMENFDLIKPNIAKKVTKKK